MPHPSPTPTARTSSALRAALPQVVHAVLALVVWVRVPYDRFEWQRWDYFMQDIPADLLLSRPLESIWYDRAQPPLWNALGALLLRLPIDVMIGLRIVNVLAGIAAIWLTRRFLIEVAGSQRIADVGAWIVALNPAVLLYEAYPLYDVLTTALVTGCATAAACRRYVLAYGVLAVLVMLRSMFHPALLVLPAPVLAGAAWRARDRLRLAGVIGVALAPALWLATHGGSTSNWGGMSLWRIAHDGYTSDQLEAFAREGVIDGAVLYPWAFSRPSEYAERWWGGRMDSSPIPVLARDDFHNAAIGAVSKTFGENAGRLIRHDPLHYLGNVGAAYAVYSSTATDQLHVGMLTPLLGIGEPASVLYLFLLWPLVGVASLVGWLGRRGPEAEEQRSRSMLLTSLLIGYVTFVGCVAELGENDRFRFTVEPLMIATILATAYAVWSELSRTAPRTVMSVSPASE